MGGDFLKRRKDFVGMIVFDVGGKKIGTVTDIYIDFYKGIVKGFKISAFSLFKKKQFIAVEDILSLNEVIVTAKTTSEEGIAFLDIKDMEVISNEGNILGVVEDVLINLLNYSIKGMIVASGIFDKIYKGKRVLLINNSILGEKEILYYEDQRISFKSLPHNLVMSNE
jgi:uncharacterized protein YrrD